VVGDAPSAPARATPGAGPCSVRSPFIRKIPFPGKNTQVGKYLPPLPAPLQKHSMPSAFITTERHFFVCVLEPFMKPPAPPAPAGASPRSPHGQGTRRPGSRPRGAHPSCSSTPSAPSTFFSPPPEISKLRRGTLCASTEAGRRGRPLRGCSRARGSCRGGGREGVKRVINYPGMWKRDGEE